MKRFPIALLGAYRTIIDYLGGNFFTKPIHIFAEKNPMHLNSKVQQGIIYKAQNEIVINFMKNVLDT